MTLTAKDCCSTCASLCEEMGVDGTVLDQPWVGRSLRKLKAGDIIRTFGKGDPIHQVGRVEREGKELFVHWADRCQRDPLRGAIALLVVSRETRKELVGV